MLAAHKENHILVASCKHHSKNFFLKKQSMQQQTWWIHQLAHLLLDVNVTDQRETYSF